MLRLIIGRAGSGKTAAMIAEIAEAVRTGRGGSMLIVPEQYSHEAERELCERCGDSLSRYAEVFSFTGLARRVMQQQGGAAADWLDKGGRMLCMALAAGAVSSRLKLYGAAARRAELQAALLSAVDECKTASVTPDMLYAAAEKAEGTLAEKLWDMALVLESYDAVVANGRADPSDRLTILASQIPTSGIGRGNRIYIDGFIDFTNQEREVIRALLASGAELTVCFTLDDLRSGDETFALSRAAARRLMDCAGELGCPLQIERMDAPGDRADCLRYLTDNLFSYSASLWAGKSPDIRLFAAPDPLAECELAAAAALSLVREEGCRWRDIAVAVRGFEDYRRVLESSFALYGVPLFTARKSELMQKPLPALIAAAYEIVGGGWDVDDVTDYLRTGLTGLSTDECDELENYLYKWQLRAPAWERESDWHQHPDGYGGKMDAEAEARLERINALRRRIAEPLRRFSRCCRRGQTAAEQASALSQLLLDLKLPEQLDSRAAALAASGREDLAAETAQLWEITVRALEQSTAILGQSAMDADEFGRLFTLMLSKYDVGTIPVSLDRVSAGDFDRMRRRNIRHLIVLGASDARLPAAEEQGGVFSEEERARLLELDIDLGGAGENELWREFSLIYNTLALPSESLTMSYPLSAGEGGAQRPSFVMNRAAALFTLPFERPDMRAVRAASRAGALALATGPSSDPVARAAAAWFAEAEPQRLDKLNRAASRERGALSPSAVRALYGSTLRLSASRIDKLASCKFSYFCQYGMKARPYEPATFRPNDVGTFIHAVLERTARETASRGGFAAVDDASLKTIVDAAIEQYIQTELGGFGEKTARFRHLFSRLRQDAWSIVRDMAAELRRSDFVPLDFELDFADTSSLPPVLLGEGEQQMQLVGVADRVDGWLHDGRLYLRVVDYKTGKKSFSLGDIWYGMGLQMLLYLFALSESGEGRYGHEIVPAGVMYVPARSAMAALDSEGTEEEIDAFLQKEARRSGLVLDDPGLIEAWEKGGDKRYIPLKFRSGKPDASGAATAERMGLLYRHIRKTLGGMAAELRRGTIAADPYLRPSRESACDRCDYAAVCHFADGGAGERGRYLPKLSAEKVWELLEGGGET